jgi:hypothetical protein
MTAMRMMASTPPPTAIPMIAPMVRTLCFVEEVAGVLLGEVIPTWFLEKTVPFRPMRTPAGGC